MRKKKGKKKKINKDIADFCRRRQAEGISRDLDCCRIVFTYTQQRSSGRSVFFCRLRFAAKRKAAAAVLLVDPVCVRAPKGLLWFDDERGRLDDVAGDYRLRWEERASKGDDP